MYMSPAEGTDMEERFRGHKCYIDFDTEELLDRRGLEGFLTEKDFLELYKDVGFQERGGYPYATVKIETFKVLKKLCDSCPLGMKMVLEHGMEKYCPLENQFSLGTVFQLKYPITRTDCPLCGKMVERFYIDKKPALISLCDVRYNGGPAKLEILRQEGTCPYCKQRLPADEIPNVQVGLKWGLTIRLIRMITKHCIEEGVWEQERRKVAEGYGISLPTVKKYVSKTCEDVRKTAERLLAYEISKPHDSRRKQECSNTNKNLQYLEVSMTEYPLKLYFTWSTSGRTTEDIVLRAAFGTETDILSFWMQGDFSQPFPPRMNNDHLTLLAHYYSGTAFPDMEHIFAFNMTRLAILFGKNLKNSDYRQAMNMVTDCLNMFRRRDISPKLFKRIEELAKWAEEHHMTQIRKVAKGILRFRDSQSAVMETSTETDTAGMERARQVALAVESAIKENKQQWDVEKNENPFVLPTRLLYLNSVALLRYPDGSLPILEDGSIDPNYIRLTGIPAEELLVLIDNGLLSQVKRRFEVEV